VSSVELAIGESSYVWNLGTNKGASSFAAGRTLSVFRVGCKVEGDKEEEVRADYAHA